MEKLTKLYHTILEEYKSELNEKSTTLPTDNVANIRGEYKKFTGKIDWKNTQRFCRRR